MKKQIKREDLNNHTFFWYYYISFFRGFDDKKEINIDEALEVIEIDRGELFTWVNNFFSDEEPETDSKFIGGKLSDDLSFYIDFRENEIVYFINDLYIGNLGGHFEAWFLTWEELLRFKQYNQLFLLLLPMVGVEEHQVNEAQEIITDYLEDIPKFRDQANYISYCILNGIKMERNFFDQPNIGIVNNENHSIRNIEKYPIYKKDVIELNLILSKM